MLLVRRLVVTDAGDRWHRQLKRDKKCLHTSTRALGLVRPKSISDSTNHIRSGQALDATWLRAAPT
jgi:hypothetical protein